MHSNHFQTYEGKRDSTNCDPSVKSDKVDKTGNELGMIPSENCAKKDSISERNSTSRSISDYEVVSNQGSKDFDENGCNDTLFLPPCGNLDSRDNCDISDIEEQDISNTVLESTNFSPVSTDFSSMADDRSSLTDNSPAFGGSSWKWVNDIKSSHCVFVSYFGLLILLEQIYYEFSSENRFFPSKPKSNHKKVSGGNCCTSNRQCWEPTQLIKKYLKKHLFHGVSSDSCTENTSKNVNIKFAYIMLPSRIKKLRPEFYLMHMAQWNMLSREDSVKFEQFEENIMRKWSTIERGASLMFIVENSYQSKMLSSSLHDFLDRVYNSIETPLLENISQLLVSEPLLNLDHRWGDRTIKHLLRPTDYIISYDTDFISCDSANSTPKKLPNVQYISIFVDDAINFEKLDIEGGCYRRSNNISHKLILRNLFVVTGKFHKIQSCLKKGREIFAFIVSKRASNSSMDSCAEYNLVAWTKILAIEISPPIDQESKNSLENMNSLSADLTNVSYSSINLSLSCIKERLIPLNLFEKFYELLRLPGVLSPSDETYGSSSFNNSHELKNFHNISKYINHQKLWFNLIYKFLKMDKHLVRHSTSFVVELPFSYTFNIVWLLGKLYQASESGFNLETIYEEWLESSIKQQNSQVKCYATHIDSRSNGHYEAESKQSCNFPASKLPNYSTSGVNSGRIGVNSTFNDNPRLLPTTRIVSIQQKSDRNLTDEIGEKKYAKQTSFDSGIII